MVSRCQEVAVRPLAYTNERKVSSQNLVVLLNIIIPFEVSETPASHGDRVNTGMVLLSQSSHVALTGW